MIDGQSEPGPTDERALRELERRTCQALVITCSDFRFKTAEREFARSIGLHDDYDLIARPGGIRSMVRPRDAAAQSTLEEEIRLLWSAHLFRRIIAVNHLSCRAYDDIANTANEREMHIDHLRRAAAALDGRFAGAGVEAYLADITSRGIEIIPVG